MVLTELADFQESRENMRIFKQFIKRIGRNYRDYRDYRKDKQSYYPYKKAVQNIYKKITPLKEIEAIYDEAERESKKAFQAVLDKHKISGLIIKRKE
jgi:hypothetical protein